MSDTSNTRGARWRRRLLFALVFVLALAGIGVYLHFKLDFPPMDAATKQAIGAIPRGVYPVAADYGGHVSYLHAGDPEGRRVIFVHGTPGDAEDLAGYLLHVPPGFEYVAVDRPGFGESGPAGSVASLQMQAAALEPLLVERHGYWPILVGHSLGGPIVTEAAADFPDKVGGLVILAGALDPSQEHIHWLQYVGEWPVIRPLLPRMIRNSNQELMPLKGQLEQLQGKLNRVMCPVEIVHGTKDRLVPYANVAFMQHEFERNPMVHLMTIPNQDHFLPWTNVAEVREAIAAVVAMTNEPAPATAAATK